MFWNHLKLTLRLGYVFKIVSRTTAHKQNAWKFDTISTPQAFCRLKKSLNKMPTGCPIRGDWPSKKGQISSPENLSILYNCRKFQSESNPIISITHNTQTLMKTGMCFVQQNKALRPSPWDSKGPNIVLWDRGSLTVRINAQLFWAALCTCAKT